MIGKDNKLFGEERRGLLVVWLREAHQPLSGKVLAERANVSRQVIVQDMSLLKAAGEPIVATSRGYVYWSDPNEAGSYTSVIAVCHDTADTADELYILVDLGVFIKNVMVEHPIYGDITGSLMLKNRRDVDTFLSELESKGASLLSRLTGGVHLHTIEADTNEQIEEAKTALRRAGYLLE